MTTINKQKSFKPQGICYTLFVINFDIDQDNDLICREVRTLGNGCKGMITTLNYIIKNRKAKEVAKELETFDVCKNNTSCALELAKALNEAVLIHSGADISQLHSKRKPPITNIGLSIQKN